MALPLYQAETGVVAQRTGWYAFVRLLFLVAIATPGLVSLYAFHGWSTEVLRDLILFMIALATNALFYGLIILHKNDTYQRILAASWIGLDVLLVTFLIVANGGIESRNVVLYVMPILIAAAILGRLATYVTAGASALMYCAAIVGDFFGFIHTAGATEPRLHTDLSYVINTVIFFSAVLIVIAIAVDFITSLLIVKEREAHERLVALKRAQELAKIETWEWDVIHDKLSWSEGLANVFRTHHAEPPSTYEEYVRFIHPNDKRAHIKVITSSLKKKKPFTTNYRLIMPDGQSKHYHGEGEPLMSKNGTVKKLFGIAQDTTEMHYLDDAKREFVALASHQLRTPASGVKAFLSLLADGYVGKLTRSQKQFVKRAYEANDRQLEIIDNLLSLAAIEARKFVMHKEPTDLNVVIRLCLPHSRLEAGEKKLKFTTRLSRRPLMVNVDASQLQMAIDNLLSNAIKYTPEKGQVTVSSFMDTTAAYIEVADSGIGIAKADMRLLFQKFTRINDPASKTVGGSGLGLYLTKYIVKLHRGKLSVDSHYGEGSRFRIKLPLLREQG